MAFLRERAGFLDAVVLSGGESTLNPDIAEVCREIKKLGYLIKVDTNGSNPQVIRNLLEEKLIDYVALDNKMPSNRSWRLPGGTLLFERYQETLKTLLLYGVEHEVRTTVHPGLLDEADILRMIRDTQALGYKGTYYLQFFFEPDKGKTLGNLEPPTRRYDRRLLDDMSPLKIGYRNFPEDRYR
jgi:pyruvate formate lyase activating enzyme